MRTSGAGQEGGCYKYRGRNVLEEITGSEIKYRWAVLIPTDGEECPCLFFQGRKLTSSGCPHD